MTGLERDRHPARFAVVTSVVSGLCVALVIAGVKAGLVTGGTVPAWSLVGVTGVAITLSGLAWIRPWRRRPGRAFLLISAFSQKHWVAELIQNTHRALDRRGIDVVLKIPDRDYVAACQVHHLRRIQAQRADYAGGFIVPVEVDRIRNDLVYFCREVRQPIVFMDVVPFSDEGAYPDNTAFVGYDAAEIGEVAADWVITYLGAAADPNPTVLVIGSREQSGRQRRFVELLNVRAPGVRVIVDDEGEFERIRASVVARRHVEQLRIAGQKLSVIFCTNDEMALGATDVLLSNGEALAGKVAVVGVDGTPEARALIDTGHSPLRATVVQDSYRIAEIATNLMEKMLSGERVTRRNHLRPEVYTGD